MTENEKQSVKNLINDSFNTLTKVQSHLIIQQSIRPMFFTDYQNLLGEIDESLTKLVQFEIEGLV
jgi:hypothetical protein